MNDPTPTQFLLHTLLFPPYILNRTLTHLFTFLTDPLSLLATLFSPLLTIYSLITSIWTLLSTANFHPLYSALTVYDSIPTVIDIVLDTLESIPSTCFDIVDGLGLEVEGVLRATGSSWEERIFRTGVVCGLGWVWGREVGRMWKENDKEMMGIKNWVGEFEKWVRRVGKWVQGQGEGVRGS